MSDAPERIWAAGGWTRRWNHEPLAGGAGTEFVRADIVAQLEAERDSLAREVERMREALRIIAGEAQCVDNLMSNVDIARAALEAEVARLRDQPEWNPQSVIAMLADRIAVLRVERNGLEAEVERLREALEGA